MRPRPQTAPRVASRGYERLRYRLFDDRATTLHVASFERSATRVRVAVIGHPSTLLSWSRSRGVSDAVVGGFFVRPHRMPLGELRIDGRPCSAVPFTHPWNQLRSCVHISGRSIRIARRPAVEPEPAGDLLQAGPLLVCDGRPVVSDGIDPEGFSAGAAQFDSDITNGRYPRAALALVGSRVIAVVCDGRSERDAGLTLTELAGALVELGAEVGINLDGGGSASLLFGARLRNRPREEHGAEILGGRPIASVLVFEPVS